MSHIVAICHIAVDMSRIAAICHIAVDMSHIAAICLTGASISRNLWGGPTYNNQNFFGEILRISFALFVRRNSTFDAVFFPY